MPTFREGGWQQVSFEEDIFYLPPAGAKPFTLKQQHLTQLCSGGSDKTQHMQGEQGKELGFGQGACGVGLVSCLGFLTCQSTCPNSTIQLSPNATPVSEFSFSISLNTN